MSSQPAQVKPGKGWFLVGALAIVAGIIAFVVIFVLGLKRLSDEVDRFARFRVPKEGIVATVTLSRAGTYTLYYEYPNGAPAEREALPQDLAITVTNKDGNTPVQVTRGGTEVSFSVSGKRAGKSAGRFSVDAPGRFDIQVTGGSAVAPYDVAVGKGVVGKFGTTVLLALGIGALLGLFGVITLIVTGMRRGRSKRALAAAGAGGAAGSPWSPGPAVGAPTWPPSTPAAPSAPSWSPAPAPAAPETSWPAAPAPAPAPAPAAPSWPPAPAPVPPPASPVAPEPAVEAPSVPSWPPAPAPAPPPPSPPAPGGWDAPAPGTPSGGPWDPPPPPPPA